MRKNTAVTATMTNTMAVVTAVSRRVGHVTFWPSARTSCKNLNGLIFAMFPAAAASGLFSDPGRSPHDIIGPESLCDRARLARGPVPARLAGVEGLEPPTPGFGDRCSS